VRYPYLGGWKESLAVCFEINLQTEHSIAKVFPGSNIVIFAQLTGGCYAPNSH